MRWSQTISVSLDYLYLVAVARNRYLGLIPSRNSVRNSFPFENRLNLCNKENNSISTNSIHPLCRVDYFIFLSTTKFNHCTMHFIGVIVSWSTNVTNKKINKLVEGSDSHFSPSLSLLAFFPFYLSYKNHLTIFTANYITVI